MATFSFALERVKQELDKYLPASVIESVCVAAGHRWRRRKFDPVFTIQLFVLQVLHFNTAITHLRHLVDLHSCKLGLPVSIRYDPANPGNSIVISENWTGLRL